MNISLTIPQLFYDLIARVFPGFFFLFMLRACLAGSFLDPTAIITSQSTTSLEQALNGLGFLVLCYFAGVFLRGLTWPSLRPPESSEFRNMFQKVRLQHPESGFRVIKLRAEAILFSSSRTGMVVVSGLALLAWFYRNTENMVSASISCSSWCLRIGLPAIIAIVFIWQEKRTWKHYHGNVKKLSILIIDHGYPHEKITLKKTETKQIASMDPGENPK